jgi:hypothetical protein
MIANRGAGVLCVLLVAGGSAAGAEKGWIPLFNDKDTTGWKLRAEKITVTRFFDAEGKLIPGAHKAKLDQKEVIRDAKSKDIPGARVEKKDGKKVVVDAEGNPIPGAKVKKVGGRDAVVDSKGQEVKEARAASETAANKSGWEVRNGELACTKPHHGNDLLTEQKFTDFQLHIEFQATGNSGVYLQGRYEIQVDNSFGAKPKVIEKDGQKVEVFDKHQCGAIYGRIAPSRNMARPPKEWQTFDVTFHGARGEGGKVTHKARVTLVWNDVQVIDNAEIDGPTGGALDGKVTEPGPLLLQGDHGRVAYRNIKIRPLITGAVESGRAADGFTPEDGYTSLFNGKDLTGWRYSKVVLADKTETPDRRFEVKEGVIVANAKDAAGKGGIRELYTVQGFPRDFHLKLEFRAEPRADSGVYIRGPQLQVRDYPTVGPYRKVKFNSGGWNELEILVRGGVVKTTVNGKALTAKDVLELTVKDGKPEARLNGQSVPVGDIRCSVGAAALCKCNGEVIEPAFPVPASGGIGLQAETGAFAFRHIRVKVLP